MRTPERVWLGWGGVVFGLAIGVAVSTLLDAVLLTCLLLFAWYVVYVAAFFWSQHAGRFSSWTRWWIIGFGAAAAAALLMITPLPGADVYHYLAEFAIWNHGGNPFVATPSQVTSDFSALSFWQWLPSQHGPALQFFGRPIIWLAHGSLIAALYWYKALLFLALLSIWWLTYRLAQTLDDRRANLVLVLTAWNPLLIYDTALSGGTDALLVAFVMLALWLCSHRRWWLGAAALTISILIKYTSGIIAPLVWLYAIRQQSTWKKKWLVGIGTPALAVGMSILFFLPFWVGAETFFGLRWVASVVSWNSLVGNVELFGETWAPHIPWVGLRWVWWVAFGLGYTAIVWWVSRRPNSLERTVAAGGVSLVWFLLVAKTWLFGKYFIWALPLLVLTPATVTLGLVTTSLVVFSPYNPGVFVLWWLPGGLGWSVWAYLKSRWNGMIRA